MVDTAGQPVVKAPRFTPVQVGEFAAGAPPSWIIKGVLPKAELVVLYGMVGLLGFLFESNIGNPFKQRWEFYAITFSLFVVLAFPGFVVRYLMRRG